MENINPSFAFDLILFMMFCLAGNGFHFQLFALWNTYKVIQFNLINIIEALVSNLLLDSFDSDGISVEISLKWTDFVFWCSSKTDILVFGLPDDKWMIISETLIRVEVYL